MIELNETKSFGRKSNVDLLTIYNILIDTINPVSTFGKIRMDTKSGNPRFKVKIQSLDSFTYEDIKPPEQLQFLDITYYNTNKKSNLKLYRKTELDSNKKNMTDFIKYS